MNTTLSLEKSWICITYLFLKPNEGTQMLSAHLKIYSTGFTYLKKILGTWKYADVQKTKAVDNSIVFCQHLVIV